MTDNAGREGEAPPLTFSLGFASPPKPLSPGSARAAALSRIDIERYLGDFVHKVGHPVWAGSKDFVDLSHRNRVILGVYLHYNLYSKTSFGKRVIISDKRRVELPGHVYYEYLLKPVID